MKVAHACLIYILGLAECHPDMRFCQTKEYDSKTHFCRDSVIHPRSPKPTTTTPRTNITPAPYHTHGKEERCGSISKGYKCCGIEQFHPDFQTCCKISSNKHKVYRGKQRKHVCCGLEAFNRRFSNIPCIHPSKNDRFSKAKRISTLHNNTYFCKKNKNVYRLKMGEKGTHAGFMFRRSFLTQLNQHRSAERKARRVPVLVAYDKYSPKRLLRQNVFLIITSKELPAANSDFYLQPTDFVYRGPRNVRRFNQKVKNEKKACRTRSNRLY